MPSMVISAWLHYKPGCAPIEKRDVHTHLTKHFSMGAVLPKVSEMKFIPRDIWELQWTIPKVSTHSSAVKGKLEQAKGNTIGLNACEIGSISIRINPKGGPGDSQPTRYPAGRPLPLHQETSTGTILFQKRIRQPLPPRNEDPPPTHYTVKPKPPLLHHEKTALPNTNLVPLGRKPSVPEWDPRPAPEDEDDKHGLRARLGLPVSPNMSHSTLVGSEEPPAAKRQRLSSFGLPTSSPQATPTHYNPYVQKQEDIEVIRDPRVFREQDSRRTSLSGLRMAGVPPKPSSSSSSLHQENEALKAKLAELERELHVERKKRGRAEDIVKDVERECRHPFVVPALLEAFVTLSHLTPG